MSRKKKSRGGRRKAAATPKEVKAQLVPGENQYEPFFCQNVPFGPELAAKMLAMKEFAGERSLIEEHGTDLALCMETGMFQWEHICLAVAVCEWDNEERRLNGRHTCYARALMQAKRGFAPRVRLAKYKVKTPDDLKILYSKFDRGAPRTRTHVVNVRLIGVDEFKGCSKSILTALTQGYSFWKYGSHGARRSKLDNLLDQLQHQDNILAWSVIPHIRKIQNNNDFRFMRRGSVIGAMFETFNKVKSDSDAFWTNVEEGLNFSSTRDPAKKLREFLAKCHAKATNTHVVVVNSESMYRVCISCFNKFRKEEEVTSIQPTRFISRKRAI